MSVLESLSSFFVSPALADTAAAMPPVTDNQSAIMRFLPLFLIFGVFYMLLIRPQQKQLEKQNEMLATLKKGDKVVTSGGIEGVIVKMEDDRHARIEIAPGVIVRVLRSTITGLATDESEENKKTDDASTKK